MAPLQRNTLIGLLASLALAGGKLAAGFLGHSSALVADGVESIAAAVGSVIVWQALRVSARPPDQAHPYGYGKAEAVAALLVGCMLLVAAALIVVEAFRQLFTPHNAPEPWTMLVLVGVIVIKEVLFRFLLRGANKHGSDAVRADAWHHRSDAITSAAAFVGVGVAIWGTRWTGVANLVYADEIAALFASGIIVITAMGLIRAPLRELLDASPEGLLDQVREAAAAVPGVRLVEKVSARKSGSGYHVDMHLHVDPLMGVRDAHVLSGIVKSAVRAKIPTVRQVLIHIEPADEASVKL
jgi:cation diffusion facilitator family transporter